MSKLADALRIAAAHLFHREISGLSFARQHAGIEVSRTRLLRAPIQTFVSSRSREDDSRSQEYLRYRVSGCSRQEAFRKGFTRKSTEVEFLQPADFGAGLWGRPASSKWTAGWLLTASRAADPCAHGGPLTRRSWSLSSSSSACRSRSDGRPDCTSSHHANGPSKPRWRHGAQRSCPCGRAILVLVEPPAESSAPITPSNRQGPHRHERLLTRTDATASLLFPRALPRTRWRLLAPLRLRAFILSETAPLNHFTGGEFRIGIARSSGAIRATAANVLRAGGSATRRSALASRQAAIESPRRPVVENARCVVGPVCARAGPVGARRRSAPGPASPSRRGAPPRPHAA